MLYEKSHPSLASYDDYCNACLLAIHSKYLDKNLNHIEEVYKFLSKNGFYKNNDLQAMSQILDFSEGKSIEKCKKAISLRESLKKVKSFGNWRLGDTYRNMICASIVASVYGDKIAEESSLEKIANNVFFNIIIALETATMMACISANVASSSASN